jgi:glyoxylase-like metal-dependent hydrolase (beta-lactamase superfamily II)
VSEATRIADGVYRCGTYYVNWYVVEEGERLTIVDAGASGYWPQLDRVLAELGRTREDIRGLVLTHGHVDHVGFAERLRVESGTRVWVHEGDEEMVRTGKNQKTEGSLLPYLRYGFAWKLLAHLARNGPTIKKLGEVSTYSDGDRLDVPGRPLAIHTPGHSRGHCALQFENGLLAGDALCTRNSLTGAEGPQLAPKAFSTDTAQAMASLDRLPESPLVCFGHGDPWTDGTEAAVTHARQVGFT